MWTVPIYGKSKPFATPTNESPIVDKNGIKYAQQVLGLFLYYGRAVDNTVLAAINKIAASQPKPTKNALSKIQMLLDCLHTYPKAKIQFYASDMKLHIYSDAADLVAPQAKSRIA